MSNFETQSHHLDAPAFEHWYRKHKSQIEWLLTEKSFMKEEVTLQVSENPMVDLSQTYIIHTPFLFHSLFGGLQALHIQLRHTYTGKIERIADGYEVTRTEYMAILSFAGFFQDGRKKIERSASRHVNIGDILYCNDVRVFADIECQNFPLFQIKNIIDGRISIGPPNILDL